MARTYSQLDLGERRTLFQLVEARRPVGEIAERLGRHRPTIYCGLGRNRFRDGDRGFCGYFPLTAQDLASRRRQRCRKLAADGGLRAHVVKRLAAGWSPQQIAGRLKRQSADGGPAVCHETIYRHVYGPECRDDGLYRLLGWDPPDGWRVPSDVLDRVGEVDVPLVRTVLAHRRAQAHVSGRIKATELERLLPSAWKAEQLTAAVDA
jgi:hypothetical protein